MNAMAPFPLPVAADIGGATIQTVNARDLHQALDNGDHFTTWISDRIRQYDFTENVDFVTFSGFSEKGRPPREYAISLDMAKELCMVERNDAGKAARRYYIECERRAAKPVDPMRALNDPAAMRGLLLTYTEKVLELEAANAELAPKADALDRLATADGSMCVTDAAKTLQIRPKDLFSYLRSHGWIYSRLGTGDIAYQDKLQSGLMEHKTTTVYRSDGSEKVSTQARVTPKGLARLAKEFPPPLQAA